MPNNENIVVSLTLMVTKDKDVKLKCSDSVSYVRRIRQDRYVSPSEIGTFY